ncbi:hypothetical protein BRARA_H00983 [Brassica rapa]|uniref:Uncharacterized protein n=1 Tax=Brassica campestris TaxID=3711 RepID=M4DWT5_BRACM|nr:uncharacterized protein LOC103834094 [Brassica rapa]RID50240.1 hypothetical protein BRARA_H00983 [Brassica rapa]
MSEEELQESDVIFSDDYFINSNKNSNKENNKGKKPATVKKSSPVTIPSRTTFRWPEVEEEEDESEMTPPHVIIGKRRVESQMAFSFSTLKGRDLSRHRISVLRMTGFLEA